MLNLRLNCIAIFSKSEFASLKGLARDDSIVLKKADKSGTIVIMNKYDYIAEVERQLHNSDYYEKLESDPSEEVKSRISDCIEKLSEQSPNISDVFDTFLSEMQTPQFYILPKTHKEFDDSLPLGYPQVVRLFPHVILVQTTYPNI